MRETLYVEIKGRKYDLAKMFDALAWAHDYVVCGDQVNAARNMAPEVLFSPLALALIDANDQARAMVEWVNAEPVASDDPAYVDA